MTWMNSKKSSIGEEASAMKDRAVGAAKDKFGEATGNPSLERRGEAQNASGQARQAANDVYTSSTDDGYVTSFYDDPTVASTAYGRLRERDYAAEDIDVVMSDQTRDKYFADTEMGTEGRRRIRGRRRRRRRRRRGAGRDLRGRLRGRRARARTRGCRADCCGAGRSRCRRCRRRVDWRDGRRRYSGRSRQDSTTRAFARVAS